MIQRKVVHSDGALICKAYRISERSRTYAEIRSDVYKRYRGAEFADSCGNAARGGGDKGYERDRTRSYGV